MTSASLVEVPLLANLSPRLSSQGRVSASVPTPSCLSVGSFFSKLSARPSSLLAAPSSPSEFYLLPQLRMPSAHCQGPSVCPQPLPASRPLHLSAWLSRGHFRRNAPHIRLPASPPQPETCPLGCLRFS